MYPELPKQDQPLVACSSALIDNIPLFVDFPPCLTPSTALPALRHTSQSQTLGNAK